MRRWIAGAVLAVSGCFEPAPDFPVVTCGTSDLTFSLGAEGFTPADGSVKYGGEVQWTNDDTVERTVTSGSEGDDKAGEAFDSGPLAAGESFCVEARDLGNIAFFADDGATGSLDVEQLEDTGGGDDTGYDDSGYMGY